jgi:glycosyltransferase involved in cell wall biosynthesis
VNKYLKDKISIIVPLYNSENYLRRCIDSLINQTYENLEIILVDDGSTDGSRKICNEYAKKDTRIKVIHKINGGISDARNTGLKISSGEYIGFVDSDDYVDTDMYELLYNNLCASGAGIAECRYNIVKNKSKPVHTGSPMTVEVFDTLGSLRELIISRKFKTTVWNKLYKKSVIDNVYFPLNKINEDVPWTFRVFTNAKKLISIDSVKYHYCFNDNSCSTSFKYLKRADWFYAYIDRLEFIKNNFGELFGLTQKMFVILIIKEYRKIYKNRHLDPTGFSRKLIKGYINQNYNSIIHNHKIGWKLKSLIRIFRMNQNLGSNIHHIYKKISDLSNVLKRRTF